MTGGVNVRRLWLVDHLLRDEVGHHAGYNAALAAAARRRGVEPVIVGHRELPGTLLPAFRTLPLFRTDLRAQPPKWMTGSRRLLDLLEFLCAKRFADDLRRMGEASGPRDVVFAQMIAPRHLLAWLRWFAAQADPPVLVLHLGYQPWRFERPSLRGALDALPETASRRLRFVTDSEKLTGPFASALGRPVRHLPHVVDVQFPADAESREQRGTLLFAAGNARREKGFGDLLQAAALVESELRAGRLSLHAQCHSADASCAEILRGFNAPPGVLLIDGGLDGDRYAAAIAGADVIVLPYHLDHYALRTSGVFCEARCAGRPVLATEGSWAGDRVRREGGGWLVPERNPQALAAAMVRAAGPELAAKSSEARSLREAARREFSPDAFIEALLGGDGMTS